MKKLKIANNKGFVLVIAIIIMVTVILMIGIYLNTVLNERVLSVKNYHKKQAFWLAEAGIERAIKQLPSTDPMNNEPLGKGTYSTTTTLVSGFTDRWTILSTGVVKSIDRKIEVIVKQFGNPAGVDFALTTQGEAKVTGNASIDTDGDGTDNEEGEDYLENTPIDFESVFGMTKTQMQALPPTYTYTDPENNQTPVSGITWVNLSVGEDFVISEEAWYGSGILVVDGDLQMTGGTFEGIIWVTGNLRTGGNAIINGAIFVEGLGAETVIIGTADITYNEDAINDAFSFMRKILSWKEVF